jgi:hypothetical protein
MNAGLTPAGKRTNAGLTLALHTVARRIAASLQ